MPDDDRAELLRRLKGHDGLPEQALSTALEEMGVEHVCNDDDLPGMPAVAVRDRRVAVFVYDCFWHGCALHCRVPKLRRAFWRAAIARIQQRDRRATLALLVGGWQVVTIWEHEIRADPKKAAARVAAAPNGQLPSLGHGRTMNPSVRLKRL